ncbi:hypothetical protein K474DRAFT_1707620 [Panus rudis PR-1116 ss-1]|nr:hypothetical protein K474DRAFT_1707620 [Panus rudis PR-1116 ss-1]
MSFPTLNKSADDNATPRVEHSQPIPIASHGHIRRRSGSISEDSNSPPSESSSESSLNSPKSPSSPLSPISGPRIAPLSPSTSPILSYFMGQPSKSPSATFPLRRNFGPVIEDDDSDDTPVTAPATVAHHAHARRASMASAWPTAADRIVSSPPQSAVPVGDNQQGRAAGLLRRLSLGAALKPPFPQPATRTRGSSPPPNTPATSPEVNRSIPPPMPTSVPAGARKTRRSNTLAPGTPRPPRAPSPMGERILKGHFDGFN